MTPSNPIEITCSRDLLEWLYTKQISLAFTTYQTNRLFLLGVKPDGALSAFERLFDRPMGLCALDNRLYMGGRYQIWQLDNALPPGQTHDGYDALYVPRRSFTTGDVDVHDVQVDKNGRLLFINTLYSCLATVSEQYSFRPLWQPPFISKLAPEDRCHLNGLALLDGEARYVTAVSRSDVYAGWRKRRESGGLLIDIQTNETVLDNLSMPHSPRWHEGKLWLLNAGSGDLGYVDQDNGRFEPIAFCPGFARGLTFHKNYAIVGLSKPRRVKAFEGLSLDDKLNSKDSDALCGLAIIDLNTGNIAHWIEVEGLVSELYDVAVLPNTRRPMALGFKNDEISRFVTIEHPDQPAIFQALKAEAETPSAFIDFMNIDTPPAPQARRQTASPYRFQLSFDMTLSTAVEWYNHLTFPELQGELARGRNYRQPLITAVAIFANEPIGVALAELSPDNQRARLVSCFVASAHRQRQVGTQLVRALAKGLAQHNVAILELNYSTDWPSAPVVAHMLQKSGWSAPQTTLYQYRINMSVHVNVRWLYDEKAVLPPDYTVFSWADISLAEQATLRQKGADGIYPPNLDPFQHSDWMAVNSVGLRYKDEVVGWMITHQPAPDTIQYTSFFLMPDHQQQKLAIPLLAASIHKHLATDIPYAIWQVEAHNETMRRFVGRYLQPYLAKQTERRLSYQRLR